MSGSTRVSFEVDNDRLIELHAIAERAGLGSLRELFDHALSLFEMAVNNAAEGRLLATLSGDESTYAVVQMTSLQHAGSKAFQVAQRRAGIHLVPKPTVKEDPSDPS